MSIRARMIVAMNVLALGAAIAVGWAGIHVSGKSIERRLIDESVANAATLAAELRLPLSDTLMARLAKIYDAQAAAGPIEKPCIAAASLPPYARAEFNRLLRQNGSAPRRVVLGGVPYLVGRSPAVPRSSEPAAAPMALYLLVPQSQVDAAKRPAAWTIAGVALLAVAIATVGGAWLSTTVSKPVRGLADRMDRLADSAAGGVPGQPAATGDIAGPPELRRLTRSFDQLLTHLADTRRQLERSARLATVGQLAASVVHELRNPLSGVKMNVRVLADELARLGVTDHSLDLIVRELDRMDLYLQKLLDLSSPGSVGAAPAEPTHFRLDESAESAADLLAGRCEHAGVQIVRRFGPTVTVLGRPDQVRQVIVNLMLNALEAMPHGGQMTLATEPGGDGAVRLSVSDTGGGVQVPPDADIFEPFLTTKSAGTGLGLHVCRQIVTRHGGRIGYTSTPRGSTFWFELPVST